jgi:hypothetical protein
MSSATHPRLNSNHSPTVGTKYKVIKTTSCLHFTITLKNPRNKQNYLYVSLLSFNILETDEIALFFLYKGAPSDSIH